MITKKVISLFTFGVFLILAGAISKFFNWSQSNLIMAIGLVFEILAALLFIWKKLKK
ncbi:gliding motility protein GldL [uncultured Lutibacter sp.]|uniref:gliding motility protein GldL n=1 Tax=uncultured Lutibacter sp. TaxID=437739 RepID=UPI0026150DFB|nr:gliding motility protein GldL [uncultured Lutibacter sp.]